MKSWYSREYLGRAFDRFLDSEMSLNDFMLLQQELQLVSEQLQALKHFIESGYQSKTGRIHIRQNEQKETSY